MPISSQDILKRLREKEKSTTTATTTTTPSTTEVPSYYNPQTLQSVPPPNQVDLGEIDKTKNASFINNVWKGIKDFAVTQYNKNIKPLKYLTKEDVVSTIREQADKVYAHPDLIYRSYGAGLYSGVKGAVEGLTLGFATLPKWKSKYEEEKETATFNEVVGGIAGYGKAVGLATTGLTKLALTPKIAQTTIARMSPGVAKAVIETTAFLGTSQLEKDLFSLTPEEKEAGVTIAEKRFNRLLLSGASLLVYRGAGKLLEKLHLVKPQDPQLFFSKYINQEAFNKVSSQLKSQGLDKYLESWATATKNNYIYNIGFGEKPIVQVVYPKENPTPDKWNIVIGTKGGVPKLKGVEPPPGTSIQSVDNVLPKINPNLPQDNITRAVVTKTLVQGLQNISENNLPLKSGIEEVSDAVIKEASKSDKVLDVIKSEFLTMAQKGTEAGEKPVISLDDAFESYILHKYPNKINPLAIADNSADLNLNARFFNQDLNSNLETTDIRKLILKYFTDIDLDTIPSSEVYKYANKAQKAIEALIQNYKIDGRKFADTHELINYLSYPSDKPPKFEYDPSPGTVASLENYREEFEKLAQRQGYKSASDMIVQWENEFSNLAEKNPDLIRGRQLAEDNGNISAINQADILHKQENALDIYEEINQELAGLSTEIATPLDPKLYETKETAEILISLEVAKAGKRYQTVGGAWTGEASSFPKWLSPQLRRRKLLDKVLEYFRKGTVPPAKNKREVRAYNEIKAQIEQANGVEVSQPLGDIDINNLPLLEGEDTLAKAEPKVGSEEKLEAKKQAFLFISPNVEIGLTYQSAIAKLNSPEHLRMLNSFKRVDEELFGVNNITIYSAAGDWIDGAENTTYSIIKNPDKDTIIYSTAVKSKIAYQKNGLWFIVGEGKDELYRIPIKRESSTELKVKKAFDNAGIQNKTIGDDEILIVNKQGDYYDPNIEQKIKNALKEIGIEKEKYHVYTGEGDFLGTQLENVPDEVVRKDAMRVYDEVIQNYEAKTGRKSNVLREEAMASVANGVTSFDEFISKFQKEGDKFVVSYNQ